MPENHYVYGSTTGFDSEYAKAHARELTTDMYSFEGQEGLISPTLVYYKDIIEANVDKILEIAGGPEKLWPHMKTHKMANMLKFLMSKGIDKFKCATIAEAEVAAKAGAKRLIISYPLVGPNIERIIALIKAFPQVDFYAIGEDFGCLSKLSEDAVAAGLKVNVLIDVNSGLNRTGVPLRDLESLMAKLATLPGIEMHGLHWYDAQFGDADPNVRDKNISESNAALEKLFDHLRETYPKLDIIAMGGSPEFAYHAKFDYPYRYLSPGTVFIQDWGYSVNYPEMPYLPGAALLTRVISNPETGFFTLDLGTKAIASDNKICRGLIVGLEHYKEVFQNEEHWVFRMEPGYEADAPKVGDEMFVIPSHICPCSQLYPEVPIVEDHKLKEFWTVDARNRKITY